MTDQAAVRTAPRDFEADTHQSFLVWRRFFYFKLAVALVIASIIAYVWHSPLGGPNGGTWLGYTLGTIGALLILWLIWFGWRKRSYTSRLGRLEGWLSAHVYLGLSLIVVATLHTGFQFGWNVHTLAYVLMMLVIASGAFGVYTYVRYPALMTGNRRGMTSQQLLGQIATIDGEMRHATMALPDAITRAVARCLQETEIGGSMRRQLTGRYPNCATEAALGSVRTLVQGLPGEDVGNARQLLVLLQRKSELLRRIRADIQFKAIMEVWLYVHVPISFALLAALTAHIISVFFYW
jgi:hypothetical protein